MRKQNQRILVVPDLHCPYHHEDAFAFLKALKKFVKPDLVVNLGDEVDKHAMSFHDSDADLPSAGDELALASASMQDLEKIFPEMTIIDSNHGSLALRRFKHHGIPIKYLASAHDIYGVGKGWQWKHDLMLQLPNGQDCYFVHGMSKNGLKIVQQRGHCVVQGHFHTDFRIDYCGNPYKLLWSLQSGCLIDKKSLAFAYDKVNLNRPILGASAIIDSQPRLFPMVLDKKSRWIGVIK